MAACGEPLAAEHDDAGLYAGKDARQFNEVHRAVSAAVHGGFVVPGDAEQVQGIHIPKADVPELLFDRLRDQGRIPHLRKGGDHNSVFACALHGALQLLRMYCQIDHAEHPMFHNIYRKYVPVRTPIV